MTLLLLASVPIVARVQAEEAATKPAFQSYTLDMPVPMDAAKLERVTDGMTLGAIVEELGPGSMLQWHGTGIISWHFEDGRELCIWPAEYKATEVITKEGKSGRSRMWVRKIDRMRLMPTTAPATTQAG